MGGSITLHPEHGVNPSLMLCFWCGEASGVALLGRNKGKQAPRQAVFDYEPCQKCKDLWATGIALIEVQRTPVADNQRAMQEGVYPTGSYLVVTREWVEHSINPPSLRDAVLRAGRCYMEPADFQQLKAAADALNAGQAGEAREEKDDG